MSSVTGSQPAGGKETIPLSVLMERLAGILDDVCSRLSDVQGVVSDHLEHGTLAAAQLERLQGLDALTQEVEAVRAVLAELGEDAPRAGDPPCQLEAVLTGVRLSQIRETLRHGERPGIGKNHGDFTLF